MSETSTEGEPKDIDSLSLFEACTPRQDVLIGELAEDQFAASIADVAHKADAPTVYSDPEVFFEKTYPTAGLQDLLERLATRFVGAHQGAYSGTNGVIRLDTSFGGGKTHSEIAAYHLAENPESVPDLSTFINPETATAYGDAASLGLDVNTAVFSGAHVDANDARAVYTDGRVKTQTMWGELAYQLFGQDGYEFLREDDNAQTSPGEAKLEQLFERQSNPSLILLDEVAAYFEQAAAVEVGDTTLAGQTNTFLMSLLKATQNTDRVTVVLTIADTAFGDQAEHVRRRVEEFNSVSDRVESSITPTDDGEIASVLRHRLFEEVDQDIAEDVADTYFSFYNGDKPSFPDSAFENGAATELETVYPFHPTLINTLTDEIDSLPSFQRTRGALQLISRAVYRLWEAKDEQKNAERDFVRLFDLHPSDETVRSTLLQLFTNADMDFEAAIKADIFAEDGRSHAEYEDRERESEGLPPLGTQLTTSILWKSLVKGADGRGVTRPQINHAVARHNVEIDHYDYSLNNLLGGDRKSACFYLHGDNGQKIQFKSEVTIEKVISSKVDQMGEGLARRHLEEALKSAIGQGGFNTIYGPEDAHEVPDSVDTAHLCVMDFDTVSFRDTTEGVPDVVQTLYEYTASTEGGQKAKRVYKNNVVFLVSTEADIIEAKQTAKRAAAIKDIQNNLGDEYDLSEAQQDKLIERLDSIKGTLDQDIKRAYTNLYYPSGNGLTRKTLTTQSTIHQSVTDALAENDELITDGDGPFGKQWFQQTAWNSNADVMSTREIEKQFGKRRDAEILLSPVPIRTTIAELVTEHEYAYWDEESETGYYAPGATLVNHSKGLDAAINLQATAAKGDIKLNDDQLLYTSIDSLVDEHAGAIDFESQTRECDTCGNVFDGDAEYESHLPCGEEVHTCEVCGTTFKSETDLEDHQPCKTTDTLTVTTSESAHVSRALQELRKDIDADLMARDPDVDDLTVTVSSIIIQTQGADEWKSGWFIADKLSDADPFAGHTQVNFTYISANGVDPTPSELDLTFSGSAEAFAEYFRFNMEPENFSADGERSADVQFTIDLTAIEDDVTYDDSFSALDETLAVDNGFTITMQATLEIEHETRGGI